MLEGKTQLLKGCIFLFDIKTKWKWKILKETKSRYLVLLSKMNQFFYFNHVEYKTTKQFKKMLMDF